MTNGRFASNPFSSFCLFHFIFFCFRLVLRRGIDCKCALCIVYRIFRVRLTAIPIYVEQTKSSFLSHFAIMNQIRRPGAMMHGHAQPEEEKSINGNYVQQAKSEQRMKKKKIFDLY